MTDTSSDRAVYRSFDNLYDATFQDVLSYCRRRTRTPEDANEATAETYLIAWRKFAELQATAKPVAWLLAVARQVLLNQRRSNDRRDRLVNRLQQQPRTLNVEISKQHEHSEVVAAVLKSLNNLDPLDQEIIALAAFEGLSYQEIAIVVNRRSSTIKSRIYRARKQLRLELNELGYMDSTNKNPAQSGSQDGRLMRERPRA